MNHVPSTTTKSVTPDTFRSLMAEFPSGVAVVAAVDPDGHPWGMTCTALCSLSVEPAVLLSCLRTGSATLTAVLRSGAFVANLLHGGARHVAEHFASATGAHDRFSSVTWSAGEAGPRLPAYSHVIADCRLRRAVDGGSHQILFGEVIRVSHHGGQAPLLYGRRRYGVWPGEPDLDDPTIEPNREAP